MNFALSPAVALLQDEDRLAELLRCEGWTEPVIERMLTGRYWDAVALPERDARWRVTGSEIYVQRNRHEADTQRHDFIPPGGRSVGSVVVPVG